MNHMIVHRYFVIKITEGGKSVFLGLGFEDRADSFDLQTTLHDYFKGLLVNVAIHLISSLKTLKGEPL